MRTSLAPLDHLAATAALLRALGGLHYPASKGDAIRHVGSARVPLTNGESLALSELLEGVDDEAFQDYSSATKAVDRNWRRVARALAAVEAAESAAAAERLHAWPPASANVERAQSRHEA